MKWHHQCTTMYVTSSHLQISVNDTYRKIMTPIGMIYIYKALVFLKIYHEIPDTYHNGFAKNLSSSTALRKLVI